MRKAQDIQIRMANGCYWYWAMATNRDAVTQHLSSSLKSNSQSEYARHGRHGCIRSHGHYKLWQDLHEEEVGPGQV